MTAPGRRRLAAVALCLTGAVLVVAGSVAWHSHPHRTVPASFGSMNTGSAPNGASDPPDAPAATAPRDRRASAIPVAVAEPGVPTRLTVPALHVRARVVPVGSQGGSITVPTAVSTVGWWVGAAAPGTAVGDTVLVGHVDSSAEGPGALFRLDSLHAGDLVEVATGSAAQHRYRVTALRTVAKSVGLGDLHLGSVAGPPRLVLVTCGGPFDERTRSYADNIVVFATPETS